MLPSNASPTISALILITGLPEFPPTISFVLAKLNGVERSKSSGRSLHPPHLTLAKYFSHSDD